MINELEQVICNIINNAIDAATEKKIENRTLVLTAFTTSEKMFCITIEDNAGGIPQDIIEKIFEPYFSTKGPEHGTGLGLFICQRILTEHFNGNITVSNHNDGAKFVITLPTV
jgi:signal transduction histidine kinase